MLIYHFNCGTKKYVTQYFNMNSTFREKLENVQKELDIALEENEALKSEKEEQVKKKSFFVFFQLYF